MDINAALFTFSHEIEQKYQEIMRQAGILTLDGEVRNIEIQTYTFYRHQTIRCLNNHNDHKC